MFIVTPATRLPVWSDCTRPLIITSDGDLVGVTVNGAVTVTPADDAAMLPVVGVVTAVVAIEKFAVDTPAAIVTRFDTVAAAFALASVTLVALVAAPLNATVPPTDVPPATKAGAITRLISVGVVVPPPLPPLPPSPAGATR